MHEGILQRGRLRRFQRFRSDEGAFKPTSKKKNKKSLKIDRATILSRFKPRAGADGTAARSTVRLVVDEVHDGRRHLLDRRLNLGRGDWLLEFLLLSF